MKRYAWSMMFLFFALGAAGLSWVKHDSDFAPLHDEPRFQALLERLKQF